MRLDLFMLHDSRAKNHRGLSVPRKNHRGLSAPRGNSDTRQIDQSAEEAFKMIELGNGRAKGTNRVVSNETKHSLRK